MPFVALILAGTYIRLADPLIPVMNRLPWKVDSALCAAVFLIADTTQIAQNFWKK